ncbi:MAG TPA: sensor histidine kinase KdpD [Chloroflexi bacterium]|nr:sensor histidine kinase KdpD [Chloroflexota bacterium]
MTPAYLPVHADTEVDAAPNPRLAGERLLVCVGPSPLSERLVRSAERLAHQLSAEWHAVYVETPAHARLSELERERAGRTLQLAEERGATAVVLSGRGIAEAVATYARNHGITKIVVGKPLRPRVVDFLRGSLIDQMSRRTQTADLYVISSARGKAPLPTPVTVTPQRPWRRYLQSAALVAGTSLLGQPIRPFIAPTNLVMLYLLAVVIAAIRLGRGPAIVAAFLSVLSFNFFFVPPRLTFVVADAQYLLTFAGLLSVGLIISTLVAEARDQTDLAQRRAAQTTALNSLSRDLAAAGDLETIMQAVRVHVNRIFNHEVTLFLPEGDRLVRQVLDGEMQLDEREREAATRAFRDQQVDGQTPSTGPLAACYFPLKTPLGVVGVLGVNPGDGDKPLTSEQRALLGAFASQTALAIERAQLAEQARQAQLLHETEKLQTALLNSISHDLRTPLSSITGVLSSLLEDEAILTEETRHYLIETASEEAERLNRLVGNLLDMTRMEAGAMRVVRKPCDVQDLAGVALSQLGDRLRTRPLEVDVPATLPLVPMDFVLITQVLVNLLDNALKYSPADSPITVRANVVGPFLEVEVADRGIGIPAEALERVFDKFYRVPQGTGMSGTGLGLSISKGIVEAHGGQIRAHQRGGGGTQVTFSLPLRDLRPGQNEVDA